MPRRLRQAPATDWYKRARRRWLIVEVATIVLLFLALLVFLSL